MKSLVAKPRQTDWLARLSQNATRMVVSSLNNVGDQQGTVGAWTNMAMKYPVLKSEGNQTAARKVNLNCILDIHDIQASRNLFLTVDNLMQL